MKQKNTKKRLPNKVILFILSCFILIFLVLIFNFLQEKNDKKMLMRSLGALKATLYESGFKDVALEYACGEDRSRKFSARSVCGNEVIYVENGTREDLRVKYDELIGIMGTQKYFVVNDSLVQNHTTKSLSVHTYSSLTEKFSKTICSLNLGIEFGETNETSELRYSLFCSN